MARQSRGSGRDPRGEPWVPRWIAGLLPARHREEWLGDLIEMWRLEDPRSGRSPLGLWWRIARSAVDARVTEWRLGDDGREAGGGGAMMMGWGADLKLAGRMLRREPIASGAAFSTLALGVWAFLTGFALVDAALLQPLGYPAEDRLAVVGQGSGGRFGVSMPDHVELVEESDLFEEAAAWQGWNVLLQAAEGPWVTVPAASVTSDYFSLLGVQPAVGRLFNPDDDRPGHEPVAVLSYRGWVTHYGARADVVGERFEHGGVSYTIVGVMADGFRDPFARLFGWEEPQIYRATPPNFHEWRTERGQVSFWSLSRLREDVTFADATAAVRTRLGEILSVSPNEVETGAWAYRDLLSAESRGSLLLLLLAGITVLAVSAANLVNLLLARGTEREGEMAVRTAMGARRGRLIRQLLVEGAVLGVVAAGVGFALTSVTVDSVVSLASGLLPSGTEVAVDGRTVAAAIAVAVLAAVFAALLPAWDSTRPSRLATLRGGRRGSTRQSPLQAGLVVTQTAMAVVLVTASGLLLRTVKALGEEDLGFDADAVTATYVSLHPQLFGGDDEQTATLDRLLERFSALPAVSNAAAITDLPMSGRVNSSRLSRPDQPEGSELKYVQTLVRAITPEWFDVMGIPVIEGRGLERNDVRGQPEVAVVNRRYVERHFPDRNPIGSTVFVRGVERRIVGVVGNATEFSVGAPRDPALYLPYAQEVQGWMRAGMYISLRTDGASLGIAELRAAGAEVDGRLSIGAPFRLREFVDQNTVGHRFRALLATSLGALALALAAVGLAGVTAYLVGRRTRELGVRVALGAEPRAIARMVLRGSSVLAGLGIVLGVAASIPVGQALAGFLYEVPPVDPWASAVAVLTLTLSSLVASAAPTWRALRIAPVEALRQE